MEGCDEYYYVEFTTHCLLPTSHIGKSRVGYYLRNGYILSELEDRSTQPTFVVNQKAGHALASGNLFNSQSPHAMRRIVVNTKYVCLSLRSSSSFSLLHIGSYRSVWRQFPPMNALAQ